MGRSALLIVLYFLSFPTESLQAGGATVTALLKDGRLVTGELLAVTDSALVLSKTFLLSEEKLKADTELIVRIRRSQVRKLSFSGKSYVPDGVLLGCIAG